MHMVPLCAFPLNRTKTFVITLTHPRQAVSTSVIDARIEEVRKNGGRTTPTSRFGRTSLTLHVYGLDEIERGTRQCHFSYCHSPLLELHHSLNIPLWLPY